LIKTFSGIVLSSLWESAIDANLDPSLIIELTEVFAWQVDFAREVQKNDRWRLTVEKYFVKVKDTSGARGIIPPGNPKEQAQAILGSNYKKVIIQQAIKAEQRIIGYKDVLDGDTGRKYFATRYALFVSGGGSILDLGISSSVGIIAHGGVHSIHMGYKQI